MINGKKVIALIPARGGSKTIPYKNIKLMNGKPLIAWSIDAAKNTKEIDTIIVSTDDDKIAQVAIKYGADVIKRPAYLAMDDSLPIDVVRYVIQKLKEIEDDYTYMVYLEPTSPLRKPEDIKKCLELIVDEKMGYDSVTTFVEAALNPHRAWKIEEGTPSPFLTDIDPWLPRQNLPKVYQLNGAVYCFLIDSVKQDSRKFLNGKIGAIIMPRERSIDIDDLFDFYIAEAFMRREK